MKGGTLNQLLVLFFCGNKGVCCFFPCLQLCCLSEIFYFLQVLLRFIPLSPCRCRASNWCSILLASSSVSFLSPNEFQLVLYSHSARSTRFSTLHGQRTLVGCLLVNLIICFRALFSALVAYSFRLLHPQALHCAMTGSTNWHCVLVSIFVVGDCIWPIFTIFYGPIVQGCI